MKDSIKTIYAAVKAIAFMYIFSAPDAPIFDTVKRPWPLWAMETSVVNAIKSIPDVIVFNTFLSDPDAKSGTTTWPPLGKFDIESMATSASIVVSGAVP